MTTQLHRQVLTFQTEEEDDWIKTIVGKDGLTAREREEQIYQEVKRQQDAERPDEQGEPTEAE